MIGRRAALGGAAALLGGCGFRPLYGRYGASGEAIRPELASIYVTVMAERQGQLLRQALQQRLAGSDDSVSKRYELSGALSIAAEAIGIQQDSSATRVRYTATSSWTLRKLDLANSVVTQGSARAVDGININNQQYFAADLETSTAFRRLADEVAQQITLDLAIYFRTHPEAA
ncbi:MAG: LPS assembly lipoprotein LptE [Acetobacteraceae bacterium]|nr:LPS assembly lipoprotein LptE [Acetobacteraceae bacterium]